jgi:DNA repair protein RadC
MKYLKKLNIKLVRGEYRNPVKGQVREPKQVYKVFQAIKDKNQETLIGVYLANDLEVRGYDTLSVGGESSALVVPEEIFERSILLKSRTFILIHNHPSGDPQPSPADQEVMRILLNQSKVMNRTFLGLIIVGDKKYWSMFEEADGGEYGLGSIH